MNCTPLEEFVNDRAKQLRASIKERDTAARCAAALKKFGLASKRFSDRAARYAEQVAVLRAEMIGHEEALRDLGPYPELHEGYVKACRGAYAPIIPRGKGKAGRTSVALSLEQRQKMHRKSRKSAVERAGGREDAPEEVTQFESEIDAGRFIRDRVIACKAALSQFELEVSECGRFTDETNNFRCEAYLGIVDLCAGCGVIIRACSHCRELLMQAEVIKGDVKDLCGEVIAPVKGLARKRGRPKKGEAS